MEDSRKLFETYWWNFSIEGLNNYDKFIEEFIAYNLAIGKKDITQELEEIVYYKGMLVIQYPVYNSQDDVDEPQKVLKADQPTGFKAGELFFKIHKEVHPKVKDLDYKFFEQFIFGYEDENLEVFFLYLGS